MLNQHWYFGLPEFLVYQILLTRRKYWVLLNIWKNFFLRRLLLLLTLPQIIRSHEAKPKSKQQKTDLREIKNVDFEQELRLLNL